MNRRVRMLTTVYICFSLLLSIWTGAGVCVCAEAPAPRMNERTSLPAGESRLTLITDLTGEYTLLAFSEGEVEARVTVNGEVLAEGTLPLTLALRERTRAEVELSAPQEFVMEWMRAALGRSALTPIELTEGTVSRSLTRACDVHWFRFAAEEAGEYLFSAARALKSGVRAELMVLAEDGVPLAVTRTAEDASAAFVRLEAGQSCLLRLCAGGEATGNYALSAQRMTEEPQTLTAERQALSLREGEWTHVTVTPETALIWESDDPEVATVSAEGVVAAQSVGACTVTAYGAGGKMLALPVTVSRTEVLGVEFAQKQLTISAGEQVYLDYRVLPSFARGAEVRFFSADEGVAHVAADGLLTAEGIGETEIRVETVSGDFSDRMTVCVTAPRPVRRALLVGIAAYADGRSRMGSINTTQGVADTLAQSRYQENGYRTVMRIDLTKAQLREEIAAAFADATENDISLFYINCHGNMYSGLAFLELYDGSRVSARELEGMLRGVPGTVVVVLDCCFSGAFIGRDSSPDNFAHGVVDVFSRSSAAEAPNAFASSKYKVLVSSSMDQNSYRLASTSPATESGMSTVFGRAFTEALGWDLIKDQSGAIRADLDDDRRVTLGEASLYLQRRTMYYLTRSPASTARQCAQVWPEGDPFILIG